MNIIFGTDQAEKLREKFTVLELDTFTIGIDGPNITAYSVIETVPLDQMPMIEGWQQLHSVLIKNFQERNWTYCTPLIEQLKGAWNLEIDSFYEILQQRINNLLATEPDKNWTHVIERPIGTSF
jgi:hypothetical protein